MRIAGYCMQCQQTEVICLFLWKIRIIFSLIRMHYNNELMCEITALIKIKKLTKSQWKSGILSTSEILKSRILYLK